MDRREVRDIRVLVPDPTGARVLVDDAGELPGMLVELEDGETTLLAAQRVVLPALGITGPVVECFIDQIAASNEADEAPIPALLELPAPPVEWTPPAGRQWAAIDAIAPTVSPGLDDYVTQLLDERRGRRAVPELRALWSRPGWYQRTTEWIAAQLEAAGRAAPTEFVQVRQWGISAVIRVETAGGRCWFKAVFPHFRAEAVITPYVDAEFPGAVAPVIAAEPEEGWLLLEDVGDRAASSDVSAHESVIRLLVSLQHAMTDRTDHLLAAGLPDRRLDGLSSAVVDALGWPSIQPWVAVSPDRAAAIGAWLRDAVAAVDTCGYPTTLVHGDFHPGNVALDGDRPVIFDWSDAAVAHPLIDVVTWTWWYESEPDRVDEIWSTFLDAWSGTVPAPRFEPLRSTFEAVASAYHFTSYAGIVAGLEPARRSEHAGGLTTFFSRLDAAVPQ